MTPRVGQVWRGPEGAEWRLLPAGNAVCTKAVGGLQEGDHNRWVWSGIQRHPDAWTLVSDAPAQSVSARIHEHTKAAMDALVTVWSREEAPQFSTAAALETWRDVTLERLVGRHTVITGQRSGKVRTLNEEIVRGNVRFVVGVDYGSIGQQSLRPEPAVPAAYCTAVASREHIDAIKDKMSPGWRSQ